MLPLENGEDIGGSSNGPASSSDGTDAGFGEMAMKNLSVSMRDYLRHVDVATKWRPVECNHVCSVLLTASAVSIDIQGRLEHLTPLVLLAGSNECN